MAKTPTSRFQRAKAHIRHAALTRTPLRLTGGMLRRSKCMTRVDLVERDVELPQLPDALDGLRIAHFSDLHAGDLLEPQAIAPLCERVAELGADLIAITGDLVDLHLSALDHMLPALASLQAPLGVYFVPGNHDYLDDQRGFVKKVRGAGLNLLINDSLALTHSDKTIEIAGIDFANDARALDRHVHDTVSRKQCDFRLLLSHHPDAFESAARHAVDLTLAGHTHGGQLTLSRSRGRKGSIGLGSLAFQYPSGLYRRGDRCLFVTSGVGSWFPLRMNCPAEIALLTLRSSPVSLRRSHP